MSTGFLANSSGPGCLPRNDQLGRWGATAAAAITLCAAQVVVACRPFAKWKDSLGLQAKSSTGEDRIDAQRIARRIERAAARLPFTTKCLPRAVAVSWLLRRRGIRHAVVFAVRPAELRDDDDALHAWVEVDAVRIIGDLQGPWIETLRVGAR